MTSGNLPLITEQQLEVYRNQGRFIVTLQNRQVYDVTDFLYDHPGGDEIIKEWENKDVTDVMRDLDSHVHSESSYEMMEDNYLIALLANDVEIEKFELANKFSGHEGAPGLKKRKPFELTGISCAEEMEIKTDYVSDYKKHQFLNLNKPLFLQVLYGGFDKDFYIEQIHRPRHYGNGSAPIFGNFLEPLSKTPWWVVPTLWLPVNGYIWFLASKGLTLSQLLTCFIGGLFIWSILEYTMHRFLFHMEKYLPNNGLALALNFLLHGVHHYLPMDRYRLVMPPALFIILATPFFKLAHGVLPFYWANGIFAGTTLGYIGYDVTHYFLHHKKLPQFLNNVKENHLEHHYKNFDLGFGVTSTLWDHVFRTCFPFYENISTIASN